MRVDLLLNLLDLGLTPVIAPICLGIENNFNVNADHVAGTIAAHDCAPAGQVPHRIYNLGNHRPEKLLDFIAVLERALGRTATKVLLPLQPGDVPESFADIEASRRDLGFEPKTTIEDGLARFVEWYKWYHRVS